MHTRAIAISNLLFSFCETRSWHKSRSGRWQCFATDRATGPASARVCTAFIDPLNPALRGLRLEPAARNNGALYHLCMIDSFSGNIEAGNVFFFVEAHWPETKETSGVVNLKIELEVVLLEL